VNAARGGPPSDPSGTLRDMGFNSALVIFAHPDDGEFMSGGTVAAWAKEGTEVHYCVVTDGSAGSNEPDVTREEMIPIREREQRAAAEVLGVTSLHFLGFRDGYLEVNLETREAVTRIVRRVRPEVIVAPDPSRLWSGSGYINHWDHKQAGTLALCAVMPDAPSRPQFPRLLDEGFEPFEVPNLWLSSEEPDTYVDISKTIDLKIEALRRHESQGTGDAEEWVRERARELGEKAGTEYAEGFHAFSFMED
jgi:LmbE family N-acetylglucosaminyl deacetylase